MEEKAEKLPTKGSEKKLILLVHQSASLYGSDKTLFDLAVAIKQSDHYKPIVVLPHKGPLTYKLQNEGVEIRELPVLKVSRSLISPKSLWKLPFKIIEEKKQFIEAFKNYDIQIIHSNTLAVLVGMLTYKNLKAKHVWHVHEIIEKPSFIKKFYRLLLVLKSDLVISNSKATQNFWLNNRERYRCKFQLAINGVDLPPIVSEESIKTTRNNLFGVPNRAVVIGLIGRINMHKGHHLLLGAFSKLATKYPDIHLVMVGSPPPNQEHFKQDLIKAIQDSPFYDRCHLVDFQNDIHKIWSSVDIAVVPTTLPEPFGLVAVEAMLNKKPVIASDCGGLTEIVCNNKTGYLFKTNNQEDLALKLESLICSKDLRNQMGAKGYERAINEFSLKKHTDRILSLYKKLIN